MSIKTKIELLAPFKWHKFSGNFPCEVVVDEVLALDKKIAIKTIGGKEVYISIDRLNKPENHPDYFSKFSPKEHKAIHVEYFVFSYILEYSESEALKYHEQIEISGDNACHLYEASAESYLLKNVVDIILAANIAKPGCLNANELYSFVHSRYINYFLDEKSNYYLTHKGVGFESLYDIVSKNDPAEWPPITQLDILEVYNWLTRFEGFEYGAAKTSLGVAYGAYSYLMGDLGENSKSSLIWSLMALEALYCIGNTSLKQQLSEKTEVFLGKRVSHKKKFRAMYDFRSRLIHGDFNIVFRHHIFDASNEQEAFDKSFYDAEESAIAVLISTFQKMCIENLYKLEFGYQLQNS